MFGDNRVQLGHGDLTGSFVRLLSDFGFELTFVGLYGISIRFLYSGPSRKRDIAGANVVSVYRALQRPEKEDENWILDPGDARSI
jgi:hypothetical protein